MTLSVNNRLSAPRPPRPNRSAPPWPPFAWPFAGSACARPSRPSRRLSRRYLRSRTPILSAGKKLLDTRHPAFLAVTNVRHQLVATWQSMSLPYPEPAIRLIRQDKIDEFTAA